MIAVPTSSLSRADYAVALRALPAEERPRYLTEHSNLPGPRANLTPVSYTHLDVYKRQLRCVPGAGAALG